MTKTVTTVQWGVRHTGGRVEIMSDVAANEGYMTAEEYAVVRAGAVGGKVVRRTITHSVTKSEWIEQ